MLALLSPASPVCPGGCKCTKYLVKCWGANLHRMPQGLDITTERLQVEVDTIHELNVNLTSGVGLNNLKVLQLVRIHLNNIETGSFQCLKSLESLTITGNEITVLKTGTFKGLLRLSRLDLSSNKISTLQPKVFDTLTQLRYLSLSDNYIQTLEQDSFQGMARHNNCPLTGTLDLSYNTISSINQTVFHGLSMFSHLNLNSYLKNTVLKPDMFSGMTCLRKLTITAPHNSWYLRNSCNRQINNLTEVIRSLPNLRVFDAKGLCVFSHHLSTSGFQGLTSLRYFNLELNNIYHLKRGMFQGLDSLRELILRQNWDLTFLGSNAFEGLHSLRTLDLTACKISTIESQAFHGLTRLWFLDLSHNPINRLAQHMFSNLVSLRELRIKQGWLGTLKYEPLVGLCSLKFVDMTGILLQGPQSDSVSHLHRMDQLQIGIVHDSETTGMTLRGMQVMKTLHIHVHKSDDVGAALNAMLQHLQYVQEINLTVSGLTSSLQIGNLNPFHLKHLDLSDGNKFPLLHVNSFTGLTTLTSLNLEFCEIEDIEVVECSNLAETPHKLGAFHGLDHLQELDLSTNQLSTLNAGVFEGLWNLQRITIEHNKISILEQGVFEGLRNIKYIDLSYNKLSVLNEGVFKGLTALDDVNLYYNEISVLSSFEGYSIQKLSLRFNKIPTLSPGVFSGLDNLHTLDISRNSISSLTPGVFQGLSNIQSLDLSDNSISSLTAGVFQGLTNIQSLDLKGNRISSLSAGVFGAVCDEDFNITCERAAKLSPSPCNVTYALTTLKYLYLSGNNVSHIHPHTFVHCNQLQELDLSDNKILTLDTDFLYTPELRMLRLKGCNIKQIPVSAFECTPALRELSLYSNNITVLNASTFKNLQNLRTIRLDWPSLYCDCQVKEIWQFLHNINADNDIHCQNVSFKETEYFLSSLECNSSSPQVAEEKVSSSTQDYLIFKLYIEPVILIIIFLSGLFSNGLLLYICVRHSDMRTATNVCVFNLAVSDLLSLIVNLSLSYWDVLHVRWELGLGMCQFFMMLKDLTVAVSVYSVVALAVERYIVTLPRLSHDISVCGVSACRIRTCMISLLWSFAITSSACAIFSAREDIRCLYCPPGSSEYISRTWTIQLVVFCLIPAVPIFILNAMTARNLYTSKNNFQGIIVDEHHSKGNKRLANMVVILAFVFSLSYLPSFILRVLVAWSLVNMDDIFFISFVTYCLFFFNSIFNPISLFIMSSKFRSHLLEFVHYVARDEPEPEPVPLSERDIEINEIKRDRAARMNKMQEKYK